MTVSAPIVFFDIAGEPEHDLQNFYANCFGWTADSGGALTVASAQSFGGALRIDPPESRLYLGVPSIADALVRIAENGGTVEKERFSVPRRFFLALFRDPAGNPMGLVEIDGNSHKVKVP